MLNCVTKQNRRILLVDDNAAILKDFRKILGGTEEQHNDLDALEAELFGDDLSGVSDEDEEQSASYYLQCVMQGQDAFHEMVLAKTHDRPYAVAFVDMRMPPGWDGLKTIQKLWTVDPHLYVVICTAYSDYSFEEISAQLSQPDRLLILKKPFDLTEVRQLAASLTEKWNRDKNGLQHVDDLEQTVRDNKLSLLDTLGQLTFSEQFLQGTLDALDSKIAIIEQNGIVSAVNSAWVQSDHIHPFEHEGFPIQTGANLLRDCTTNSSEESEAMTHVCDAIRDILSGAKQRFSTEIQITRGTKELWFAIQITRFRNASIDRAVLSCDDITETKSLQQQLAQSQKLESIGQLAAGVAHEINTPIQFVNDNMYFLQETFSDLQPMIDDVEKWIESAESTGTMSPELEILQQQFKGADWEFARQEIPLSLNQSLEGIQRVSRIVHAMTELSHPGTDKVPNVQINDVVKSAVTVSANEWKYVADLDLRLEPTLPSITCSPAEINQAIVNILTNAGHAIRDTIESQRNGNSGELGRITVETVAFEDCIEIRISDTGTGIPEDIQPKIFDPFFTTKEVGKGTGQGLSLAYSMIVDRHAGSISFKSTVGQGTTFTIQLSRTIS